MLPPHSTIPLPAAERPILMVVVDTEEEFPWSQFDRRNTSVTAMAEVHQGQRICDAHGITPTYVADFPVVSQPDGYAPLREILDDQRCVIGAHLHPWVTPPFTEAVNARNSYPGNLDRALERAKLRELKGAIENNLGVQATAYKAGRYGLGANTYSLLEQEGFDVDLSPSPPYDFSSDGGPDYSTWNANPFWFGSERRLLGIPNTGAYVGIAGRLSPRLAHRLWRFATRSPMARFRVPGIFARLHLTSRIRLSPEGFSLGDLQTLTRFLLRAGQRVFVLSYHSSSLKPGCTQYVQTADDRVAFLATLNDYFAFFLRELGGVTMTPLQLRQRLLESQPPSPS
ncbi:MAG: polysaccharide deacetylase family protein [Planctomycetota bacterium]